jgi:alanyl-tRNA synthetase
VRRTGDIGLFKVLAEGGVAAGVRRIEAVTGQGALDYIRENEARLLRVAELVKGSRDDVERKVEQMNARLRTLEKELAQLQGQVASGAGEELAQQAVQVNGMRVLAAKLQGVDSKGLREAVDRLKDKLGTAAVVLSAVQDGKVTLIAGVTKDLAGRLHAGELVNHVAQQVGGKGGGRPDMAQAGGNDPGKLDAALAQVPEWVEKHLR